MLHLYFLAERLLKWNVKTIKPSLGSFAKVGILGQNKLLGF
jgi:hypothetical protein